MSYWWKQIVCDVCYYGSYGYLSDHKQCHTGEKPIVCDLSSYRIGGYPIDYIQCKVKVDYTMLSILSSYMIVYSVLYMLVSFLFNFGPRKVLKKGDVFPRPITQKSHF